MIGYRDVTVRRAGVDILRDFNLEIESGDKVLLFGKSGIGKSTLLKLLLGFERPDEGSVYVDGKQLDGDRAWDVRRRVSYVSQDLDIAEGKVSGFVDAVLGFKANDGVDADARMASVMNLLELERGILDKDFEDLSGGEKQRVAIMMAMLLDRDIYLLDEVTSSVDPPMKKKLVEHFTAMDKATVVAVSHDVTWLEAVGLKVVRLGRE
jgi:putative ABC transport system ATP-binding protein